MSIALIVFGNEVGLRKAAGELFLPLVR